MKNKIKFGILLFFIVFAGCSDFLKEDPRNQTSADDFFKSGQDAWNSVNALYRSGVPTFFNAGIYNGSAFSRPGYLSGLFDNGYSGQELFVGNALNLKLDGSANNSELNSMWASAYDAIARRANFAINNIPSCPGLNDSERKQLLAEAKFFRALNYFFLVKMYGPVPKVEKYYRSLDDIYLRRSSEKAIYDFIVKDLTEALTEGGLAELSMPSNKFRVSRASVAALLCDVYLNMAGYPINDIKGYENAAKIAKDYLLDDKYRGKYDLIQHAGDIHTNPEKSAYNILRTEDNTDEYLYVYEYNSAISDGGARPAWCFPIEAAGWKEFKYSITNLAYDPVETLHKVYDPTDDLRYQEKQYFHSSYTQKVGENEGKVRTFPKAPYFWFEEDALLSTALSNKNQALYRLAEIYLIAAEADVRSKNAITDDAVKYLAKVKARASLTKSEADIVAELKAISSVNAFVEEVWKEKIRELIFENKIWNDISRTRKYPDVAAAKTGVFRFIDLIGAKNYFGATFANKDLYFPLSNSEIQRNPLLLEPVLE